MKAVLSHTASSRTSRAVTSPCRVEIHTRSSPVMPSFLCGFPVHIHGRFPVFKNKPLGMHGSLGFAGEQPQRKTILPLGRGDEAGQRRVSGSLSCGLKISIFCDGVANLLSAQGMS
jgi:hypothetical protein